MFLDFYIWELNSEMVFIDSTALNGDRTAFRYLLDNNGYTLQKILHYSFGMHLGGTYECRTEREGEEGINLRPSIIEVQYFASDISLHVYTLTGSLFQLIVVLLTWRLTVILPRKRHPNEDSDLNNLSAANVGVSNQQMQYEQEQYNYEKHQRTQEMMPFDENVILQTPVRRPSASTAPEKTPSETHDVLY